MASELRLRVKAARRRRVFTDDQIEDTKLRRCLNTFDLTSLGLGSTLGVGLYALVGPVAVQLAGPSVVLSFLIAAVAALFAGLCYAEFGARVPRAGAAYIYAYATEGQLAAFWVGWINILEYVIGAASVARGLSSFVDWSSGGVISAAFNSTMPITVGQPLSPYFDMFALLLVIAVGVLLALGTRISVTVNNILSSVNMSMVLFIIVAGATVANSGNWSISEETVPLGYGSGGFFPYGAWGTFQGAAVCFYGFVGFDSISATGEEVAKPRSALPKTILIVLAVASLAYCVVAIVATMMVPYYLLSNVAEAFSLAEMEWAMWMVIVGGVFGITSSLFGALYPLSRLLYSMASDGLFFSWFGHVLSKNQAPVVATLLPTAVIGVLAAIFELDQLVMMMTTGTLISYTVVAGGVVLHRYRSSEVSRGEHAPNKIKQIVGLGEKSPSKATSCIVEAMLVLFMVACVASALVVRHARSPVAPVIIVNVLALLLLVAMTLQPRVAHQFTFKTPLVPIIPCLSISANIHLMSFLSTDTWIRVGVWMLIGIPFYIIFACCCRPKKENNLEENLKMSHAYKNGSPVQIVVESPTPPDTINATSNSDGGRSIPLKDDNEIEEMQEIARSNEIMPYEVEEIIVQHAAVIENNEEREAKIIDMLDKVLQAEEDTYGEIISLKDADVEVNAMSENVVHRKSFSDLSDAGSDASLGIQVLSKYDVIAQVHREDLPKLTEEQPDKGEADILESNNEVEEQELVTAFNDSETNSRTDESGYSDTLDRTVLNDSVEDVKETPYIPPPPPFDENFFSNSNFKKSYTLHVVTSRSARRRSLEHEPEENKPRESVKSNSSQLGDGNITFGSDRQVNFMSKLNDMMQKRIEAVPNESKDEDQRKRSNSTGHVAENVEFSVKRPILPYLMEIKKMKPMEPAQILRPVNVEEKNSPEIRVEDDDSDEGDTAMSRDILKSKLENLYRNGGPQNMLRPRPMQSNPPTPEEAYQSDTSSSESISKLPKMEKNDTIKRQKDKFSEVLNSFRLSFNKDDAV